MLRRGIWLTLLVSGAMALAQIPGVPSQNSGGNGSQNGSQNGGATPGGMGSNPGSNSTGSSNANSSVNKVLRSGGLPGDSPRDSGEAISGRVILGDGDEPGANILVQRVCGSSIAGETRTDSGGRFTLSRAGSTSYTADGSNSSVPEVWGCELRATLSGYHTGTVPAGSARSSDGGEAVILLHRAGAASRMTISATFLLAPKNARKLYDNGLEAMRRHSPDQAQKDFQEAVRIYPRFAGAWFELGKVYEQRAHRAEARDAYAKAIAADAAYMFPYERLYRMDIQESHWKEAAETSNKVLRLDPYEFSEAYYFNAVANLELNQLDLAERSAREAVKLEGSQAEPRGNYVLGLILWRKGELDAAKEKLDVFLSGFSDATAGPERASAEKMLASIERQKLRRQARQASGR